MYSSIGGDSTGQSLVLSHSVMELFAGADEITWLGGKIPMTSLKSLPNNYNLIRWLKNREPMIMHNP